MAFRAPLSLPHPLLCPEHQRRLALLKQTPKYNAAAKVRRDWLDAQALVKEFEV